MVGPLPLTEKGNCYIFTGVNKFTHWPIGVPLASKTAQGIAEAIDKHIIAEHGVCQELLTDQLYRKWHRSWVLRR